MLPRRHRRSISVEGELYYWHFTTGREFDHRSPQLVVQPAQGGQLLVVKQRAWPEVTPAFVQNQIVKAREVGWQSRDGNGRFEIDRQDESS